jgi:uncharacterized protein YhdP
MGVRIKGDLNQFPFAQPKSGELHFAGKARGLQMAYVPPRLQAAGEAPWPVLTNLNGDLVFDRLSMKLSNANAKWGGMAVINGQAGIADMAHNALLEVAAESRNTPANELLSLVQKHIQLCPPRTSSAGPVTASASKLDQWGQRLKAFQPTA